MSELRDMAAALAAISKSLSAIEEHTARAVANGEQLRIGMHDLRNEMQKMTTFMGLIEHRLAEDARAQEMILDSVEALQSTMAEHRREIGKRIRKLEDPNEVTQS